MKVAIYGRISTDRQSEISIEAQFDACRKYCERNNWDIYSYYAEIGVSGTGTEKRGQLQKLLNDAQDHKFNIVVAHKVDRAFRNTRDYENTKYDLEQLGIFMAFADSGSNEDPNHELLNGIYSVFAQNYSRNLSRETKKTAKIRVQAGQFLGGFPPLGYKVVNKKFEIDDDTAPIVVDIYDKYASGLSMQDICDEINAEGHKTARGSVFRVTTLHEILKNEKYIGIYVHNKNSYSKHGHRVGKTKNIDDLVRFEGAIPAIINKSVWEEVQKKMEDNKKQNRYKSAKREYLLSGLMVCKECGYSFSGCPKKGKSGEPILYYSCGGRQRHTGCKTPSVRVDWIDSKVTDLIMELCDKINADELVADVNAKRKKAKVDIVKKLKVLEAKYNKLMYEGGKIFDGYIEYGSTPIIKAQMIQNTKDLEAMAALIEEAKKEKEDNKVVKTDMFIEVLNFAKNLIVTGTIAQKRSAIQAAVSKIIVENDKVIVYLKPTSGNSESGYEEMVAEAGFEPTTFGL